MNLGPGSFFLATHLLYMDRAPPTPGNVNFRSASVRRLTARSREVSMSRDSGLNFSNRSEIWQVLLPRCLSNFRAIRPLQHPISRLRDFTRFGGKTSYRLVNRGPDLCLVYFINHSVQFERVNRASRHFYQMHDPATLFCVCNHCMPLQDREPTASQTATRF